MPKFGDIEYKHVRNGGVTLTFVPVQELAKMQGLKETFLRADEFGQLVWNSFNIHASQEWVLVADRLSLGDLVAFAMGEDYVRRVDFALPMADASPYWLGWDYNNKSTFGEALTAQTVMRNYHTVAKAGLG